jgi:hypothetical protein
MPLENKNSKFSERLDYKKGMSLILASEFVEILRIAAYILKALCLLLYLVKHLTEVARIIDLRNI